MSHSLESNFRIYTEKGEKKNKEMKKNMWKRKIKREMKPTILKVKLNFEPLLCHYHMLSLLHVAQSLMFLSVFSEHLSHSRPTYYGGPGYSECLLFVSFLFESKESSSELKQSLKLKLTSEKKREKHTSVFLKLINNESFVKMKLVLN